jgi:ribosomal protein S18
MVFPDLVGDHHPPTGFVLLVAEYSMTVERPASSALTIDGLSYADWEDDADRLRQFATSTGRVTKRHLADAEKLLSRLDEELEAIASVSSTLTGFDAIRVACVRDLLVAFRISVSETHRLLLARTTRRTARPQKAAA